MEASSSSGFFELSVNQKELWKMGGEIDQRYHQFVIHIKGRLEVSRLISSIKEVVRRHEVLSSCCRISEDAVFPTQHCIYDEEIELYGAHDEPRQWAEVSEQASAWLGRPYDITSDRPVRFYLARTVSLEYFLFIRLYYLWGDSYSCHLLHHEICSVYFDQEQLPPVNQGIVYRNFSKWQNDLIREPEEEAVAYWSNYQYGLRDHIVPFEKEHTGKFIPERITVTSIAGNIPELSLLRIWGNFIQSFSDNDVTIGYVPFSRNYPELNGTAGPVTRALPVTFRGTAAQPIEEQGREVERSVEEVISWGDYFMPVDLNSIKEGGYHFFDHYFEYIDLKRDKSSLTEELSFEITDLYGTTAPFSLKLVCLDHGPHCTIHLYYDSNRYDNAGIAVLLSQLKQRLAAAASVPYNGLSGEEAGIILSSNRTAVALATDRTIPELIDDRARATPNAIAVTCGDEQLTYRELRELSDRLAHFLLKKHSMGAGDPVGILLERSLGQIVAVLGVMKAGGAYVPIDPAYPEQRVKYILKDCRARLLITDPSLWKEVVADVVAINISDALVPGVEEMDIKLESDTDRLAYIIYTSGSTGFPKGCMITHRNLSNYLQWASGYYCKDEREGNCGLVTSLAFDLTVTCLYMPLIRGRQLYLAEGGKDMQQLLRAFILHPGIDTIKLTPAHISLLDGMEIEHSDIRNVICGGEQLTWQQIDILRNINKEIRIFNEYGPTETTVGVIVKKIEKEDEKVLVGKPIANTHVYILDKDNNETPVGVKGEIYIGGESVGAGYIHQPVLSGEKFLTDPFRQGKKIYRTGDSGRWMPDGNIEFLGRNDDQVKIRGNRIEPGEIEAALVNYPGTGSAVVVPRPAGDGEKELVAYFTSKENPAVEDLQSYLKERLPAFMIPHRWVQLDEMPLTPNGKIDRKALTVRQETNAPAIEYVAPRNKIEEKLALIWQEVLGKDRVGIKDNFFISGGHSLKATRLAAKIHQAFNTRITLKQLLTTVILEEQARIIAESRKDLFNAIPKVEQMPDYELSPSQRRLWILSRFDGGGVAYNIPKAYVFEGELNRESLEFSLDVLIRRHESLRTVFRENERGDIRQLIVSPEMSEFKMEYVDLQDREDGEEYAAKLVKTAFVKPFNLSLGPLLRVALIRLTERKWLFCYVMHHIISDGWSMDILMRELLAVYNARLHGEAHVLTPLRIQYKDYSAWQQMQLAGEMNHRNYWLQQMEGELPLLQIPGQKARPSVKTYIGGAASVDIPAITLHKMKGILQRNDSTVFMGLLAIVKILLYKYTGARDIIIGTPVAGREHIDLEDQIGFYINTLALRTRFSEYDSYVQVLEKVRLVTLAAYDHQIYPFDELVNELGLGRDLSRNPLFDVMVILQNIHLSGHTGPQTLENIKVSDYNIAGQQRSKFDLTCYFSESEEGAHLRVIYNKDIYYDSTAEKFVSHFSRILASAIAQPEIPVSQLSHLSLVEEQAFREEARDAISSFNAAITEEF